MKKTAMVLIVFTILARSLGFLRELVLAYCFGAGVIADAYVTAIVIPESFFYFLNTAIAIVFIPYYLRLKQEDGPSAARRFVRALALRLQVVAAVLVVLGLGFTKQLLWFFAAGISGEALELTRGFTSIAIVSAFAMSMVTVLTAYLQAHKHYYVLVLVSLPINLALIGGILATYWTGTLWYMPWGIVLAAVFQMLFLWQAAHRAKFSIALPSRGEKKSKALLPFFRMVLPIALAVGGHRYNVILDRALASQYGAGMISIFSYASRLSMMVEGLVGTSIVIVMYASMSRLMAENDTKGMKKSFQEGLFMLMALIVPATVFGLIYVQPVTELVYGRGAFLRRFAANLNMPPVLSH